MIVEQKDFPEPYGSFASFSIKRMKIPRSGGSETNMVQIDPTDLYNGTSIDFVCIDEDDAKRLYTAMIRSKNISMASTE